jgi:hypothetical protein
MSQLGRISGPLLKDNLIRDDVDLAFDTDLLYLDVTNRRIGNNTDAPVRDLNIIGKTYVDGDLIATGTTAKIGNLIINSTNNINSSTGPIIIQPTGADAYVQYGDTTNANIRIKDNFLRATNTNGNLDLDPAGAGKVLVNSSATVDGNVLVNGNIRSNNNVTLGGVLTIGNNVVDTLTVNTDFTQTIVPGDDNLYDLGTTLKRWRNFWLNGTFNTTSATITTLFVSDQIRFQSNRIESIQSNDDLIFSADTGTINLESLEFTNSDITNLLNSNIRFVMTGTGYLKVDDTNAMKVPVGSDAQRIGAEVGETRWNTDRQYLECFDGTVWQVATGGGVVVTTTIMSEFADVYTLIFG